jgi:hypothetical protein
MRSSGCGRCQTANALAFTPFKHAVKACLYPKYLITGRMTLAEAGRFMYCCSGVAVDSALGARDGGTFSSGDGWRGT